MNDILKELTDLANQIEKLSGKVYRAKKISQTLMILHKHKN